MKKTILLVVLLILIPAIYAKEGHITLVAVKETETGLEGSIADLALEIKPGSGRGFLDTFPLTKTDTQISTRFAKEIACDYIDFDCSRYDFIYTITADSAIIGGPSAGAAATILTISLLDNLKLDDGITITGTINSGGLIGPVGGISAKIDAASEAKIKKVLIPKGERFVKEDKTETINAINDSVIINLTKNNQTLGLVSYGEKKGVKITEVSDLSEVIYEFTGKRIREADGELVIDSKYKKTMEGLAIQLCNRSEELRRKAIREDIYNDEGIMAVKESALNLTKLGEEAYKKGIHYSSASYCFGANVKFSYILSYLQNKSEGEDIQNKINKTEMIIEQLNKRIDEEDKKTITDLEAYAVIKERLIEAKDYLKSVNKSHSLYDLAYAIERVYSANSWLAFFDNRGKEFDLNKEILKKSCQDKILEAEERLQYVSLFFPGGLDGTDNELDYAYKDLDNCDFELCLFKASKAKAESDVILSTFGVEEDRTLDLINQKSEIVKKDLIKQVKKGIFPVIGYSYYEYANDLKETDQYSALLYLEYALELSNIDLYLKTDKKDDNIFVNKNLLIIFILGVGIGFFLSIGWAKKQKMDEGKTKKKIKNPSRTLKKNALLGKKR